MPPLAQRVFCEWLGTAFLLMGWSAPASWRSGCPAVTMRLRCLCNTLPTGAILVVLILVFGPLSGAHFNPAVSLAFALRGELPWRVAGSTSPRSLPAGLPGCGRRT